MNENDSLSTIILRSAGIYSGEALERIATQRAANPGMGLAEAAVKFGGVKEKDFLSAIGKALGLECVDLEKQNPNPDALQKLPASAVTQFNVLPFRIDADSLTIVSSDPFDTKAADGLRLGRPHQDGPCAEGRGREGREEVLRRRRRGDREDA